MVISETASRDLHLDADWWNRDLAFPLLIVLLSALQVEARKKVAKMVLVFVVIFCVCWAPRHIYMIWFTFNPNRMSDYNDAWHYFRIIAFCLSFLNSCINPFALYLLSKQFRKYYNRYLFCCCHTRRLSPPGELTSTMRNYTSTVRRNSVTEYTVMKSDAVWRNWVTCCEIVRRPCLFTLADYKCHVCSKLVLVNIRI